MIIVNSLAFAAFCSFIFLPRLLSQLQVDISKPSPQTTFLIALLNLRLRLLSYITPTQYAAKVTKLYVYPLKSTGYLEVESWEVGEYGMKYDREYMLAFWNEQLKQYDPITQRNAPRLSLVKIKANLKENWFEFAYPVANGVESFRLPCDVDEEWLQENQIEDDKKTRLWGVDFSSVNIGKALPESFKISMNIDKFNKCTLLYSPQGKKVRTYHPKGLTKMRSTQFQDYYPFHVMPQQQVDELNSRLKGRQVEPVQFRPNFVVDDIPNHIDPEQWFKLTLKTKSGPQYFTTSSRTPRCSIPNVILEKGEFDKRNQVSSELRKYRAVDSGGPNLTFLGSCIIHHESGYIVSVGDEFWVSEKRINLYKELS